MVRPFGVGRYQTVGQVQNTKQLTLMYAKAADHHCIYTSEYPKNGDVRSSIQCILLWCFEQHGHHSCQGNVASTTNVLNPDVPVAFPKQRDYLTQLREIHHMAVVMQRLPSDALERSRQALSEFVFFTNL